MNNESEVQIEEQKIDENAESTEKVETEEVSETKPKKVEETPEARVARLKRELKRAQQKAGIEEAIEVKPTLKPFSLDRADKAFLIANGIRGNDEYDLVTDFVRNTGKDIEDLVDNRYFNAQLKELRSTRESRLASNSLAGNNRSGQSPRDTLDYWISKDEMPPIHMTQLRRDWVNKKMEIIKNKESKFTDHPLG